MHNKSLWRILEVAKNSCCFDLFFRGGESHTNTKDVDYVILADCIYYEEVWSYFIKFLFIAMLIFQQVIF